MTARKVNHDQKERIRRMAAVLFARNGYHSTGVQELSDAVGLGRGALYHHIGSKEALFEDVSTRHIREMIEIGEALLRELVDAEEKVRRLSRAQMRTIADHRAEWILFQRDATMLQGPVRKRIFATRDRYEAIWAAIIEQGVNSGEFRALDAIAVKGILGMYNYGYLWMRPLGRLAPDEIADVFCDILLGGICAQEGDSGADGSR